MNQIYRIRPSSTFESFKPQNEQQVEVLESLEQLAVLVGDKLEKDDYLDHAKMISLFGDPGRGKSHLLEAFLNHLKGRLQDRIEILCLMRGKYAHYHLSDPGMGNKRVVVIDDLFPSYNSVADLSASTDIPYLSRFLSEAYENRQLVLTGSNFSTKGIISVVTEHDEVGRIQSRMKEMSSAEIELKGEDYREVLARQRDEGANKLFNL